MSVSPLCDIRRKSAFHPKADIRPVTVVSGGHASPACGPLVPALRANRATTVVSGYTQDPMNDNSDPFNFAAFDIRGPNSDGEVWLLADTPERQRGFKLGLPGCC